MRWPVRLWLGLLALLTFHRLMAWQNDATLWQDALQTTPCSLRAHLNVAAYARDHGDEATAEEEFSRVFAIQMHADPECP